MNLGSITSQAIADKLWDEKMKIEQIRHGQQVVMVWGWQLPKLIPKPVEVILA
jgi:hypothetical protein